MAELKKQGANPRVRVGVKFMKNLGNFENVTIDVAVEEDAHPSETLEQAEARLWEFVNAQLGFRLAEVLADRKKSKRTQQG